MIEKIGKFIYKTDKSLDHVWQTKFRHILDYMRPPAFVRFTPGGYVTKFIDGFDLHGENMTDKEPEEILLNSLQRRRIIKIFRDIVYAGIKTNYTLADFTKKNIIIHNNTPYLIDYDVIVEGHLSEDYIQIFQQMLDYLEIDYKFDGNLWRLREHLN